MHIVSGVNAAGVEQYYPLIIHAKFSPDEDLLQRALMRSGLDVEVDKKPEEEDLDDGSVLVRYPNLYFCTGDIYNLHMQLGAKFVHLPELLPNLDLVFSVPLGEGRARRAKDPPRLFSKPFVVLLREGAEPIVVAAEAARARFGDEVTPCYDAATGHICRYTRPGQPDVAPYDAQWSEPEQEPLVQGPHEPDTILRRVPLAHNTLSAEERDLFFPGHRALRVPLEPRLVGLVDELWTTTGTPKLAKDLCANIISEQRATIFAIKAPCGSGKTEAIKLGLERLLRDHPETKVIQYSSRRSFAQDVERVFRDLGFQNYMNIDESRIVASRVIVSLESLQRIGSQPDVLVIDEAPEMMQQMLATTVKQKSYTFYLWKQQIRKAKFIILASDDMTERPVAFVRGIRGDKQDQVVFYKHSGGGTRGKVAFVSSLQDTIKLLMDQLYDGKRVVVNCASKELANQLKERIEREMADKKVLLDTGDTGDDVQRQVTEDPNYLRQFDLFIYTSVLGTGVSIKIAGHFSCVFQFAEQSHRLNLEKQALWRVRDIISRTFYVHILEAGPAAAVALTPQQVRLAYQQAGEVNIECLAQVAEQCRRFQAKDREVLDPLLLDLMCEDIAACSLDMADFEQRYMRHLIEDCALELIEVSEALFALGRVSDVAALGELKKALSQRIERKRNEAVVLSKARFGEGEEFPSVEAIKKKQRKGQATERDKMALTANYHQDYMHTKALTPAQHRDLALPGFIRCLRNFEDLVFTANVCSVTKPATLEANREQGYCAIYSLLCILGFDYQPLLDREGVLFHGKMRLSPGDEAWVRAHWASLCTLANVNGEEDLYGSAGKTACFFNKTVEVGVVPRVVVLKLVGKLLGKYTKLRFKRTETVKNMKLCDLPAIVLPDRKHIRLKPNDWLDQVVVPLADEANLARYHTTSVSTLVLGPKELVDCMVEFIYDRAVNGNIPQVYEPLAQRAHERKIRFGGDEDAMAGSHADEKDVKGLERVSGEQGKVLEKWSKVLAEIDE